MPYAKLRGKITEKNKTYAECAEALGLSTYSFSQKINGNVRFWLDEVAKLSIFLGLSKDEIYTIFLKDLMEVA